MTTEAPEEGRVAPLNATRPFVQADVTLGTLVGGLKLVVGGLIAGGAITAVSPALPMRFSPICSSVRKCSIPQLGSAPRC